jgi:hypothetical protein
MINRDHAQRVGHVVFKSLLLDFSIFADYRVR